MTERTHKKIDLAAEQLTTAFHIFLDGTSMASALTLAGAAEEILGQESERRDTSNAIGKMYDTQKTFLELLYGKPVDLKSYRDEFNYPRNAIKHFRDSKEHQIKVNLEDAALWMIVRAFSNYRLLSLPHLECEAEFNHWFYVNVAGS